ncbi:MAG: hypothetical protein KKD18_05400 [Nanoarchaeota archaeon]|nr:hypothetical protein [Nanoarchaeota archaeon]
MAKTINQRIANTNLYVFSRDPAAGLFTYSRPITPDEGRDVAGQITINGGLGATNEGVLYNMSTLKGIVANRALMKQTGGKVWFPTISEGLSLHDAGLLPKGELMDFGIVVYNGGNPDKEIAQALTETARQKGYALPILASFTSLDLNIGGERYGFTPVIVSEDGLITGTDATDTLKRFITGDSGVRRLCRGRLGDWDAGWYVDLDGFGEYCRVGRVSAVGSEKNLRELVSSQIEQNYNAQRRKLEQQMQSLREQERECVASAEKVLKA